MSGRVYLLAGCLALAPPLGATRLDTPDTALLQVSEWVVSTAGGAVTLQGSAATLRTPGSTATGLRLDWAERLDQPQTGAQPMIAAIPWQDVVPRRRSVPLRPGEGTAASSISESAVVARLLALADRHCRAATPALREALMAQLVALRAGDAWFGFRQQLVLNGRMRTLSWDLHVDRSGSWFAGTPSLDAPGTGVLRARYTPRAARSGLPAALRYQDAGWLRWQLEDATGHPLADPGGRDTGGVFDGATGLQCLLGIVRSGCAAGQESLADLIERLGAASADLTVASALQPRYAVDASGQRFAVARLQVDRWLESRDGRCATLPLRYVNAFQAAFVLDAHLAHFRMTPGRGWVLLGESATQLLSPLQDWTRQTLALSVVPGPALTHQIIDPQRSRLIDMDLLPPAIQQVEASPIGCRMAQAMSLAGDTP